VYHVKLVQSNLRPNIVSLRAFPNEPLSSDQLYVLNTSPE